MAHRYGQIAEYGTDEYNNNKSVRTVLEKATWVSTHSISLPIELYHRTEGYSIAGSCATWGGEVFGVRFYNKDGTTGGRMFKTYTEATEYWSKFNLVERKVVADVQTILKAI